MGPTAANGHNLQGGLVGGKTEIIVVTDGKERIGRRSAQR